MPDLRVVPLTLPDLEVLPTDFPVAGGIVPGFGIQGLGDSGGQEGPEATSGVAQQDGTTAQGGTEGIGGADEMPLPAGGAASSWVNPAAGSDVFVTVPVPTGADPSLARLGIFSLSDSVPLGREELDSEDIIAVWRPATPPSHLTACATASLLHGMGLLGPRPDTLEGPTTTLGFDGLAATLAEPPQTARSACRPSPPGDVERRGFVVAVESGGPATGNQTGRPAGADSETPIHGGASRSGLRTTGARPADADPHASGPVRGPAATAIATLAEALQPEAHAAQQLLVVFGMATIKTVVIPPSPQPGAILKATLVHIPSHKHARFDEVIGVLTMLAPLPVVERGGRIRDAHSQWLERQLGRGRVWTVGGVRASLSALQDRAHPTTHPTIARILDSDTARHYSARGTPPRLPTGKIVTLADVSRDFVQGSRSERELIREAFAPHARITAAGLIQALGRLPDLAQLLREITSDGEPRVTRVGRSHNDTQSDGGDGDGQDRGEEGDAD